MATNSRSVIVRLRAEMAQFRKEWDAGTGSVRGTARELENARKKATQTEKAIDKSGTAVGRLSERLTNNRQAWDEVGTGFLRVGAGLTAMSVLVGKAAMDWETAWAGVTKTVDGTDAEMLTLEDDLRSLAKTLPATHQEIAATAEAAGQLGVERENVAAFTKTMIDLSETTNLSAEEAATSIQQLMNVMQTAPGDVDNLGAALVALGNDGASTERDIIQMAQRIAGAGEIVGLTESDVLGLANALASSGIEVEAGGSAISNVLIDISKAVSSGGEELTNWAAVAGSSADQFAAKWKSDPAMALADFTEGLGQMASEGGDVFGVLEELGQSDVRVTRALLNMANSGDMLRQSLRTGSAEWERNTALAEEAAKRYDTTAAKAQIAWNNVKDNAIDAGQGILPIVSSLSDGVVGLASVFGSLPDYVQGGLGVLTAFSGVSLLAVGGTMKLAGAVMDSQDAFRRLEVRAPRASRALAAAGKGAAILTAALLAVDASADLFNADEVANVEKFTGALLTLAGGGDGAAETIEALSSRKAGTFLGASIAGDVNSLSDAIDTLDASKWEKFINSGFGESKIDLARDVIEQTDAALTSLVKDGAVDDAAAGFDYFAKQAEKVGLSSEAALKQLPGYAAALDDIANDQTKAASAAEQLAAGSLAVEMRLAQLGGGDKAVEMLQELKDATVDTAMGFLDLSANLDTSTMGFDTWLAELEKMEKAQESWADNLIEATTRGVDEGVIEKFKEMGPEGAARLAELVDASDAEIERLNDVFGDGMNNALGLAEILESYPDEVVTAFELDGDDDAVGRAARVAAEYGIVPENVRTILEANDWASEDIDAVLSLMRLYDGSLAEADVRARTEQAKSAISSIIRSLNSIPLFKQITIRTVKVESASKSDRGNEARAPRAGGGPIVGAGGPTDDLVPIDASHGEHMWTAAEVQALGGHGAMYALRSAVRGGKRPLFAVGGAVDDAWNESYRAAAATYGGASSPSVSGAAAIDISGFLSASQDLRGLQIGFDRNGLLQLIRGELDLMINGQDNFRGRETRRTGRP